MDDKDDTMIDAAAAAGKDTSRRDALLAKIKAELDNCERPLFFFDDDPDGLCSFLQFYRYKQAGKGVVVKVHPVLDEKFTNAVRDYGPDKIFILDIPKVSETFIKKLSRPIVYIDHHDIAKHDVENMIYFNPHIYDKNDSRCVSYWCYRVINGFDTSGVSGNAVNLVNAVKNDAKKDDIWIAMVGCIGDWSLPDFKDEFISEYPGFLKKTVTRPEEALFKSRIGRLTRIFSFVLKGNHNDVVASIKVLTRIKHPNEILKQHSSPGRFIFRRFETIDKYYKELINSISDENIDGDILSFMYTEKHWSFTSDLSNELLYKYPDKVIMVCREKGGEFKCSIRSAKFKLPEKITSALEGLEGYGGGHDYACGACVKSQDFEKFVERLKGMLK